MFSPKTRLGLVHILAQPLLRAKGRNLLTASFHRPENRLCHVPSCPVPPSETRAFANLLWRREETEVEADIAIFLPETKELNEVSDTWHWTPWTSECSLGLHALTPWASPTSACQIGWEVSLLYEIQLHREFWDLCFCSVPLYPQKF